MTYWTVSLPGGPKRANQAAVALGSKIYSFGGFEFDAWEEANIADEVFGIHILDTDYYRWCKSLGMSDKYIHLSVGLYERFRHSLLHGDDTNDNDNDNIIDNDELNALLADIPDQRNGHTVVTYKGKFYMWGGFARELHLCTVLFCFDPVKENWSRVQFANESSPGRARHTAVVFNDMMIVYGGTDNDLTTLPTNISAFNFETSTWYEIITEGESPRGRQFHTACIINKKMYVFGGVDINMNDLCLDVFNLETNCWEIPDVSGDIPCGRRNHSAWVYRGMMYIFGGYQHSRRQHLNTLHEFNPETSRWRLLQQYGLCPRMPRQRHCSVVVNDRVFLFGGLTPLVHLDEASGAECLIELCDLHVLNYAWTLKDLCIISILRNQLDKTVLSILPRVIR
ncbi:hypothetical protein DINM_005374 [Dirofilaria immitis]|nr:hypothetical protein [Dirofilaria immitis]